MSRRREDIAETRKRITEAAVQLHGSVGPAHTTFSAVAELAGVQRSTVYRHFPTEEALFGACTSHWLATHPWPRIEDWRAVSEPAERMRYALRQVYEYFAGNEQMLANSYRDIAVMPVFVAEMMTALVAAMHDTLLEAWPVEARDRLHGVVAVALDFRAWQAMRDAGWSPARAAGAMTDLATITARE
jgi:AcrR family transcriptional regulator